MSNRFKAVRASRLNGPPLPLDLKFTPNELRMNFGAACLSLGRCFGSKSGYLQAHPRAEFLPNANVFCRRHGKIWWGDLDLRSDKPALEKVARRLRCRLYVLRESDGRFQNAALPHESVVCRAVWHTGGATRVPGVARILRRSGLGVAQLAWLANVRRSRLTKPQPPEIALEANRRLVKYDKVCGGIAADLGFRKWGEWWTRQSASLGGESRLAVLLSGREMALGTLMEDVGDRHCFGLFELMTMISGNRL